jgi:protein-S-isoprenylcysteine O-methyltransferase Ste14
MQTVPAPSDTMEMKRGLRPMNLTNRSTILMYKAPTGNKTIRLLLMPLAGLSHLLFAMFFVIVSLVVDVLCGFPRFPSAPTNFVLSIPIISLGLFTVSWSVFHVVKARGVPELFSASFRLTSTGPYAVVRNPMLSGIFMLLFGIGIAFGSMALIFFFTPLFILIYAVEIKTIEEPELKTRLGREYIEYKNNTPMFFPGIGLIFGNRDPLSIRQPTGLNKEDR